MFHVSGSNSFSMIFWPVKVVSYEWNKSDILRSCSEAPVPIVMVLQTINRTLLRFVLRQYI